MRALVQGGSAMRKGTQRSRHGALHRAAPLVLLLLCLRALVPAGFMLASVDGRLDIVLCDSGAGLHHHHHHDEGGGGSGNPGHDSICPYALSGGPAPLPAIVYAGVTAIAGIESPPPLPVAQTCPRCGPVRLQTSRGPPQLA